MLIFFFSVDQGGGAYRAAGRGQRCANLCFCHRGGDEEHCLHTSRILAVAAQPIRFAGYSCRRHLDNTTDYFEGKFNKCHDIIESSIVVDL